MVSFGYFSLGEEALISAANFTVLGENQDARGEAVETVRRREIAVAGRATHLHGGGLGNVLSSRHGGQEWRFIHHKEIVVLVNGFAAVWDRYFRSRGAVRTRYPRWL